MELTYGLTLAFVGTGLFSLVFACARVRRNLRRNRDVRANLNRGLDGTGYSRTDSGSDTKPGLVAYDVANSRTVPLGSFDAGTHLDKLRDGAANRAARVDEAGLGTVRGDNPPAGDPGVLHLGDVHSSTSQAVTGRS